MKCSLHIFTSLAVLNLVQPAPTERRSKHLPFLDYDSAYDLDHAYNPMDHAYAPMDLEEADLGRTLPRPPQPYNSPIYYIRLPPQPYVFVPGLGYVSQPSHQQQVSPFVNLPLSFVANGKPGNVYQWSGAFQGFPAAQAPPPRRPAPSVGVAKPQKPAQPDSMIHRLPGAFAFNGKPEDVFVLRDSYNSLLSDVLQNVYP